MRVYAYFNTYESTKVNGVAMGNDKSDVGTQDASRLGYQSMIGTGCVKFEAQYGNLTNQEKQKKVLNKILTF